MRLLLQCVAGAFCAVLLGSATQAQTIAQLLSGDDRFTTFSYLVESADRTNRLDRPGAYTVFAPTDAAIKRLPPAEVNQLMNSTPQEINRFVRLHVDDRKLTSKMISGRTVYIKPMLKKQRLCISRVNGRIYVGDGQARFARIVVKDVIASNGVIHVIDRVLKPGPNTRCK